MILKLLLAINLISKGLSKQFLLLPYNSLLCKNYSQAIHKYYEFTIIHQINLNTNGNVSEIENVLKPFKDQSLSQLDNENAQYYLCRALLKPMGRPLEMHNERGEYSFWNVRLMIDRIMGINECNDYLLLQFRHKDNHITALEGHSAKTMNITCRDKLPIVVRSELRKLYITYFSSDSTSPGYVINITSFIYFQGDFSTQYQQDLCRQQDGFWCVNMTVCIFRDMRCDGFDSCFDGGSDEVDCVGINNYTVYTVGDVRRKTSSRFIDYLPWLALGILPLILLFALICICNQHRNEAFFDMEEDNLDVDKSNDGDGVWSSVDHLEKINDEEDFSDEAGIEQCEDNGGNMGLVALSPTVTNDTPYSTNQVTWQDGQIETTEGNTQHTATTSDNNNHNEETGSLVMNGIDHNKSDDVLIITNNTRILTTNDNTKL